jgi:hypothetical protein
MRDRKRRKIGREETVGVRKVGRRRRKTETIELAGSHAVCILCSSG